MPNRRTQFYPWKNFILDTSFPPPFDLNCKFKLIPIGGRVFNFLSQVPLYPRGGGGINFMTLLNFPPILIQIPQNFILHGSKRASPKVEFVIFVSICSLSRGKSSRCKDVSASDVSVLRAIFRNLICRAGDVRVISVSVFLIRRYFPGRDQTEGVEGIESQFCPWLILV